jgi:hypothetical protein
MSNQNKPNYEPLEAGDYTLRMNRFEEKKTKNGAGVMISAGFEVVKGEHKGRLVFHNFLVEHTNPKAQEIGNQQLDAYLKSVGVNDGLEGIGYDRSQLEDYTELPFTAGVGIQEASEYKAADGSTKTSKARNVIKKFMAR